MSTERAEQALRTAGLAYRVLRREPADSLEETARRRGIRVDQIVKTLVVRLEEGRYLFVLVGGDRRVSWLKLRHALGISRLTMPDAAEAKRATGYARGTITPFGAVHAWPVVADRGVLGRQVSMGSGEPGATVIVDGTAMVRALGARVEDVSVPGDGAGPRPSGSAAEPFRPT